MKEHELISKPMDFSEKWDWLAAPSQYRFIDRNRKASKSSNTQCPRFPKNRFLWNRIFAFDPTSIGESLWNWNRCGSPVTRLLIDPSGRGIMGGKANVTLSIQRIERLRWRGRCSFTWLEMTGRQLRITSYWQLTKLLRMRGEIFRLPSSIRAFSLNEN
jgi:hypothetical protein